MRRTCYLRTDEREEMVRSLEWAELTARGVHADPYLWKWVLTALHNAVQGVMVLTLWQGNGLLTMSPKAAARWLAAHQSGSDYPDDKLDRFLNLYQKVKDPANFPYLQAVVFPAAKHHDYGLTTLNSLRNDFTHFTPKGWALQLAGLPAICASSLELVEFFAVQTQGVFWHKASHRGRVQRASRRLRRVLLSLGAKYGG
jgi:hypothetical protein